MEFGVVRDAGGAVKAFGAGILSSYGELEHLASGAATLEPLDCFRPLPRMSYKVRGVSGLERWVVGGRWVILSGMVGGCGGCP